MIFCFRVLVTRSFVQTRQFTFQGYPNFFIVFSILFFFGRICFFFDEGI